MLLVEYEKLSGRAQTGMGTGLHQFHIKNIFADGELSREATVKESLTVQTEGGREVKRSLAYYNLDLVLAIGYRVRSAQGVQFRQWASTHLKQFLIISLITLPAWMKPTTFIWKPMTDLAISGWYGRQVHQVWAMTS